MNKNFFYGSLVILLLTSAITLLSCKKDKIDEKETATKGTATAVVKYEGKTLNFLSERDSAVAFLEWVATEKKNSFRLVLKDDATGMLLDMIIYPVKEGAATYFLNGMTNESWSYANFLMKGRNSSDKDLYVFIYSDNNGVITQSKGTVNISSMTNKNVKGTFSLNLHNYNFATKEFKELTVSGGSFDVPLVKRDFDFSNMP